MKETGKAIYRTDMGNNPGKMDLSIKDITNKGKSMEKASTYGLTDLHMMVIGLIIKLTDMYYKVGHIHLA